MTLILAKKVKTSMVAMMAASVAGIVKTAPWQISVKCTLAVFALLYW